MIKLYRVFFLIMVTLYSACNRQKVEIYSPDKNILFSFRLKGQKPEFSVSFKRTEIIHPSGFSLSFERGRKWGDHLQMKSPSTGKGEDNYSLMVGKTSRVLDHYNWAIIPLQETTAPNRRIDIEVRIFNDGLAFRYEFQKNDHWTTINLRSENTVFRVSGNPAVTTLFRPNFTTSHEGEYSNLPFQAIRNDTLMDLPSLFEFPGPIFMAITEAGLRDYAGMYLIKKEGLLQSELSPLPDRQGVAVTAGLPHNSPWRVLMISDRVGDLIESNLITDLNEPCKIADTSWIKPGKTTWPWWNGDIVSDPKINAGNNFETQKYYIDFCARHHLEYHSVVEYGGQAWYVNDGEGFMPGPHTDVTKPVPGLDMTEVCSYAKQQGVGIRLWVHWAALYPQIDSAFALYEKWGVKGLMVDFMDRDDQEMVNIQEEILRKAAEHRLHIQFHGAYKPTGLWRTYPNEFTREGVMNYEYDKWSQVTPDHDMNVVFTRLLAGPTDYHLGGFRAVPEALFKSQNARPFVLGTRCHMLAMYVVLESYLSMVCDYPDAYEGQPGFEFIEKVPTTWDETKVLDAEPGKFISIARRKGDDWYAGAITNHEGRSMIIDFGFLGAGDYQAEIFTDVPDGDIHPDRLEKRIIFVKKTDKLPIHLSPGGGMAMRLVKKRNPEEDVSPAN